MESHASACPSPAPVVNEEAQSVRGVDLVTVIARAPSVPLSAPTEVAVVDLDNLSGSYEVVTLIPAVAAVTDSLSATAPPDMSTTDVSGPASSSAVRGSPLKAGKATPDCWEELATDRSPSRRGTSADLSHLQTSGTLLAIGETLTATPDFRREISR